MLPKGAMGLHMWSEMYEICWVLCINKKKPQDMALSSPLTIFTAYKERKKEWPSVIRFEAIAGRP